MIRSCLALLFAVLAAPSAIAGDPSMIEDSNFMPESGWNRTDAVVQYSTFFLGSATSHELTQEWAASTPRHQLSYVVPFYSERESGLGDVMLSYRYQAVGGEGSQFAIAPRVSLVLPTRSERFGAASRGVQLNVPISALLTERVVSHTNVGASWYHDRDQRELNVSQQVALSVSDRISVTLDAAYTRGFKGDDMFVVRPGVQFAFEVPGGLQLAPGIAFPRGGSSEGVLLFVSVARAMQTR